jgi:chromosome segregation ATPase
MRTGPNRTEDPLIRSRDRDCTSDNCPSEDCSSGDSSDDDFAAWNSRNCNRANDKFRKAVEARDALAKKLETMRKKCQALAAKAVDEGELVAIKADRDRAEEQLKKVTSELGAVRVDRDLLRDRERKGLLEDLAAQSKISDLEREVTRLKAELTSAKEWEPRYRDTVTRWHTERETCNAKLGQVKTGLEKAIKHGKEVEKSREEIQGIKGLLRDRGISVDGGLREGVERLMEERDMAVKTMNKVKGIWVYCIVVYGVQASQLEQGS